MPGFPPARGGDFASANGATSALKKTPRCRWGLPVSLNSGHDEAENVGSGTGLKVPQLGESGVPPPAQICLSLTMLLWLSLPRSVKLSPGIPRCIQRPCRLLLVRRS